MKTSILLKSLTATAAVLFLAATTFAGEKEEKVPLDQVPAAVKKTLEANATANDATLGEVTRETEDGKVVYEADAVRSDGSKLEIEVGEDGKLLEIESKNK